MGARTVIIQFTRLIYTRCRLCLSRYWTVLNKNTSTRTHASTKKAESARDVADLPILRSCSDGNRSSQVQQGVGKVALRRAGCEGTG